MFGIASVVSPLGIGPVDPVLGGGVAYPIGSTFMLPEKDHAANNVCCDRTL